MNLLSWFLLGAVAAGLIAVVVHMVKNRKRCSCGGNCAACGESCARKKKV